MSQAQMAKRLLVQLLPIGIFTGLFLVTGSRVGISKSSQVWINSCRFSVGASVGAAGFQGIAPDQEPKTFIRSVASLVNRALECGN